LFKQETTALKINHKAVLESLPQTQCFQYNVYFM